VAGRHPVDSGDADESARRQPLRYLPHIEVLLRTLRISHDRLDSRSKVAIDARLLRLLLQHLAARLPFSHEFYAATYPDLRQAHASGAIADLHRHFVESGFFEGRIGFPPDVDDAFYLAENPDVAGAVANGAFASATEHYIRAGAAEGRMPNPDTQSSAAPWAPVLRAMPQAVAG
jgi:hypothetical protein